MNRSIFPPAWILGFALWLSMLNLSLEGSGNRFAAAQTTLLPCGVNVSATDSATYGGLTLTQKQSLLDAHNAVRLNVSSRATSMPLLEWSQSLAEAAVGSIVTCPTPLTVQSVSARTNVAGFSYVGQNALEFYSTVVTDPASAVATWQSSVAGFTPQTCSSPLQNLCGLCVLSSPLSAPSACYPYVQIIWAATLKVGCGMVVCGSKTYLSCMYGPGGVISGQMAYTPGSPPSGCQTPAAGSAAAPAEESTPVWKTALYVVGGIVGALVCGVGYFMFDSGDICCCFTCCCEDKKKSRRIRAQSDAKDINDSLDDTIRSAYIAMNAEEEAQ